MRYFVITYYKKANGDTDEATAVTRNLKTRDLQCANVILDFKKLEVVKASMGGVQVPKDFNTITSYYRKHYKNIIDRLFVENNWQIVDVDSEKKEEEKQGAE